MDQWIFIFCWCGGRSSPHLLCLASNRVSTLSHCDDTLTSAHTHTRKPIAVNLVLCASAGNPFRDIGAKDRKGSTTHTHTAQWLYTHIISSNELIFGPAFSSQRGTLAFGRWSKIYTEIEGGKTDEKEFWLPSMSSCGMLLCFSFVPAPKFGAEVSRFLPSIVPSHSRTIILRLHFVCVVLFFPLFLFVLSVL